MVVRVKEGERVIERKVVCFIRILSHVYENHENFIDQLHGESVEATHGLSARICEVGR